MSSANDPRHAEESRIERRIWRVGERVGHGNGGARLVVSFGPFGADVRHRWYAGRIDLLHLLGIVEDAGELPREQILLLLGQLEVRERRDALDILFRQFRRHAPIVPYDDAMHVRRAAVAGSWYPGHPDRLAREVDEYIGEADVEPDVPAPTVIVAPHAGLRYSGPVAAYAYKAASAASRRTVVLVGPSHFIPFRGVSIWPAGAWETPFGRVAVDEELAAAIAGESRDIVERPDAHGREHSLEMQMPFVAHLLSGVSIVPLVMGYQTREVAFGLGDAIAAALTRRAGDRQQGHDVLLVASSDLSHYEDAVTAARMDAVVLRHVGALDPDALMAALEREPAHACGGGPMVAVLHAARRLGATQARVLRYADSGDVSGDKSSVVGYMAAAIW